MHNQFEVGTKVKIVAPEGFDLNEYCNTGEWEDISYVPDYMKEFVNSIGVITETLSYAPGSKVQGWHWPDSWLKVINKVKPKPSGKDFLGNIIRAGDSVIYTRKGYRELKVGTILNVTPTGARIITGKTQYDGSEETFFQTFDQIVKKP